MKELSLHILDIIQNSIKAKPRKIKLIIQEKEDDNRLTIIVEDDGIGMDKMLLERVCDPFTTTRKTRRVGLGISLLKAAAERCQGDFSISSELGKGTKVIANFQYDHIDRAPLGNIAETIVSVILSLDDIDFIYQHKYNQRMFLLDTREIKRVLGAEVSIVQMEVIQWIKEYVEKGLKNLYGGVEGENH